jgi:hypothetical protein
MLCGNNVHKYSSVYMATWWLSEKNIHAVGLIEVTSYVLKVWMELNHNYSSKFV